MCQVSSPDFIKRNMSLKTFKKIIDQNPQFIKIKIQGLGEPLVNKEIFEMIKYANDKFIKVNTVTNGSLLNNENIKKILAVKINELSISIDGASKKVFETIRLGSNFDTVIKNVENLTSNRSKNIKKIQSLTLIQKKNFSELEDIIKLCKRLNLDEIQFQYLLTSWGKDDWKTINNEQQIDNENKFFDLIQMYQRKYQDNNLK
jgi:MoaA/NifB/PqqE/SkfB family radical SAM enzyme